MRILLLTLVLVCTGCDLGLPAGDPPVGYGLPVVELTLDRDAKHWLQGNIHAERYVRADLRYDGAAYPIEVRHQGGISRTSWKKNFRVQVLDGALPGGLREVILSAQFSDPSMLAARIGFGLFADAGFPVPDTRWVALYLDGAYHGLYLMIEPVDVAFLERRGKREGSLYRATRDADLTFRDGPYDVRDGLEKKWGAAGNFTDLETLIHVIDATPAADLPARLEPLLDVHAYLDYVAVSVVIDHRDAFFKNYLLYRDPDLGRFTIIPWDLDDAFSTPAVWFPFGRNHLSARLMEVPAYRAYYLDRLHDLATRVFPQERLAREARAYGARIAEAYRHDPYLQARGYDLAALTDRLITLMQERHENLARLIRESSESE